MRVRTCHLCGTETSDWYPMEGNFGKLVDNEPPCRCAECQRKFVQNGPSDGPAYQKARRAGRQPGWSNTHYERPESPFGD